MDVPNSISYADVWSAPSAEEDLAVVGGGGGVGVVDGVTSLVFFYPFLFFLWYFFSLSILVSFFIIDVVVIIPPRDIPYGGAPSPPHPPTPPPFRPQPTQQCGRTSQSDQDNRQPCRQVAVGHQPFIPLPYSHSVFLCNGGFRSGSGTPGTCSKRRQCLSSDGLDLGGIGKLLRYLTARTMPQNGGCAGACGELDGTYTSHSPTHPSASRLGRENKWTADRNVSSAVPAGAGWA